MVNKTDLAPYVGVDLTQLEADTKVARGPRPYVMARIRQGHGVAEVVAWLEKEGGLVLAAVGGTRGKVREEYDAKVR